MNGNQGFPFSAIVGQENYKLALILNAVNPRVGGVLIRGEKGTAKSTAVRALADLLPRVEVVEGCAYACDPGRPEELCESCERLGGSMPTRLKRRPVVTLPLNATEDRVAGGIDFDSAVRQGVRVLQPGLLARAHRGILYVDEVNLLDDHLVDIILDAAASGENRIEREGVSHRHPSRFILVGTMNPEEGELRPQLLDRFGLCVEVTGEQDIEKRMELMKLREEFDSDPKGFVQRFAEENREIAARIDRACAALETVRMAKHLRSFIGELCGENHVAGHRADLVVEQAARALAAYMGRGEVTVEDIQEVAPMALMHRKRDVAPPPPPPPPEPEDRPPDQGEAESGKEQQEEPSEKTPSEEENEALPPQDLPPPDPGEKERDREGEQDVLERIFEVGATFKVRSFQARKDRLLRRGSGRRSRSRVSQKQGRYVRSTNREINGDIALDATLRAAAPHQLRRRGESDLAVCLRPDDIREKIREKRIGNFLLFLVDASGSMGARGRMAASKGAIMSLLLDAYQKRDQVAMVSFRKREAVLNLPPTSSVEMAGKLLEEMPVGGRTPLAAGLVKAYEVLRSRLLKDPSSRPFVIVITDGKANAGLGEGSPLDEAFALASRLALDERLHFIVVDTEEENVVSFGLARKLAMILRGSYFRIEDLKAENLVEIIKGKAA